MIPLLIESLNKFLFDENDPISDRKLRQIFIEEKKANKKLLHTK